MKTVYIVFGLYYPDAPKALMAFQNRENAEKFLAIEEHKRRYDSLSIEEVILYDENEVSLLDVKSKEE